MLFLSRIGVQLHRWDLPIPLAGPQESLDIWNFECVCSLLTTNSIKKDRIQPYLFWIPKVFKIILTQYLVISRGNPGFLSRCDFPEVENSCGIKIATSKALGPQWTIDTSLLNQMHFSMGPKFLRIGTGVLLIWYDQCLAHSRLSINICWMDEWIQ